MCMHMLNISFHAEVRLLIAYPSPPPPNCVHDFIEPLPSRQTSFENCPYSNTTILILKTYTEQVRWWYHRYYEMKALQMLVLVMSRRLNIK